MADADARHRPPCPTFAVGANRLTLLADGPERLEALISLIDGARETIRILYYIWEEDESGARVRDALLAAVQRGVDVSLLVDGFGASGASEAFFQPLIDSDCRFCRFVPRWGRRFLLRNHQKLALVDAKRVIIGGFNISDDYFGTVEAGAWRDLGLEVEGPDVACLVRYFDELFRWAKNPRARIWTLRRLLGRHSTTSGQLHWLFGGPTRRLSPWARSIKKDMLRARRLDMISAYFAPGRSMLRRIYGVARRGRVRIVTAAKTDNPASLGAARHTYHRLMKRGVEIYEYQATKLHTKLIVIDDVVHVGSANFDMRSFYLNLEMMLRVNDAKFAKAMRRFIDGEIADSRLIAAEEHERQRSWWNRLRWAIAYFIVATADYNLARRLNFAGRERDA
jgi:cardiolipin synthase A/B